LHRHLETDIQTERERETPLWCARLFRPSNPRTTLEPDDDDPPVEPAILHSIDREGCFLSSSSISIERRRARAPT